MHKTYYYPLLHDLSFAKLLRLLGYRRLLLAGMAFAGFSGGLAFGLFTTPIYRAEVLLSIPSEQSGDGPLSALAGQYGGLASLAGISLPQGDAKGAEAVATLQSRALTASVVQELQLLPILFAAKWDQHSAGWRSGVDVPTVWDADKLFNKRIRKITEDKKNGLITLRIEWTDPRLATQWASELVTRTNKLLQAKAITKSESNIAYLKQQSEQATVVEVRQAIYRVLEREVTTLMLAKSSDEYAFKVVDPAVVPEDRVQPNASIFAVFGLFGGFFLGIALSVVLGAPLAH